MGRRIPAHPGEDLEGRGDSPGERRAKGQKETRIIDTLGPVLTQHRMVVAESFLRQDAATEERNYAFLYQLTHITRDRGALTHDDRVDAVAGAVAHFQRAMMMDVDQAAKAMRDEEMLAEIEDFSKASISRPIEA